MHHRTVHYGVSLLPEEIITMSLPSLHSFGELLKAFRKQRGLTQQQLATILGVHRHAIGRWERGDFLPENKSIILELIRVLQLNDLAARQFLEASLTTPAHFWNVPYQRNPFFTGRQAVLQALHQRLRARQITSLTQSHALHGLGGIGKTQLAVEYAYTYALEYSAVLWVNAETRKNIISSFLAIAELLRLPESRDGDQQYTIAALQRWLRTHQGWLLIWDNLQELELLPRYLPTGHQGIVLITTRCPALGTLAQGLELPIMAVEEGLLFLLRRSKLLPITAASQQLQLFAHRFPADYAAATELVQFMGGLPLALDQAGAYLEETGCTLNRYLRLYQQQEFALLERRGTAASDHPQSVAATLILSYQRVAQTNPVAAELLCQSAFLHPDAIPEELLETDLALSELEQPQAPGDTYHRDQALAILRRFSLINRSPESQTLSVHRLFQVVIKEKLDSLAQQRRIEQTTQRLNAIFPTGAEADNWPHCQRYLAHVEVCSHLLTQWNIRSIEAEQLLRRAGVYLREIAQYQLSERFLLQSLEICQQILEPEHVDIATTLSDLARLYQTMGRYAEADPLLPRAPTMHEQLLSKNV